MDNDDDSGSDAEGITIYQPLITNNDYYWLGQTLAEENWIFTEYSKNTRFLPFCEIGDFEEIWRSEKDGDNQARTSFAL
jgi:hypothetical protein